MPLPTPYDPTLFRAAGHDAVERLADYLEAAFAGQVPAVPPLDRLGDAARLAGPMPRQGAPDARAAIAALLEQAIAESTHTHHPGSMGHQVAPALPVAALGDLVSALLNQGMAVYETGPFSTQVDRQVVRWLADAVGFGPKADGVFTSGGSLGTLTALLAARNHATAGKAWGEGVAACPPLAILVSEQAHYCVARAAGIMGLGQGAVIKVGTDPTFRMDMGDLAAKADAAEAAGRQVMAVVGSACTTAAGSYDPLPAIADLCEARGYWLHVDGAHGASVLLSPRYRSLAAGIERADSVVWDAHKMLFTPALATAVLFRDGAHGYAAFQQEAAYLFVADERDFDLGQRTVECTKRMMAFKLWLALHVHGADGLGDLVTRTHDLSRALATMLDAAPDFELLTSPQANIVCFRHRPEGYGGDLDALQETLRAALLAEGGFHVVQTRLRGAVWLRVSIMNAATEEATLATLLTRLRALAGASSVAG